MPPKGSTTVVLPPYMEKRGSKIRCRICHGPAQPGADDSEEWMARGSLTRHLTSKGHLDALENYEAQMRTLAVAQARSADAAMLNSVSTQGRSRSPLPSVPGATHFDTNGIDPYELESAQYSAGGHEEERMKARSRDLLECYGVEEILADLREETISDESLSGSLPQQILRTLVLEDLGAEEVQTRFSGLDSSTSDWHPYENKTQFFLDLLDNIPRLRLSSEHLRLIFWIMEEAGCRNMLKLHSFRKMQSRLRSTCAIRSHQYRSARGNVFDMMDVPQLIGRDLSNPTIAPHLNFYPEVSSGAISEVWQSDKWRDGVPLDQLTPMYADGGKHFYVNELSRLHDGRLVIPYRWIKRDGNLTADCRQVVWVDGSASGAESGLEVLEDIHHIPAAVFASNYLDIVEHMDPSSYHFIGNSQAYQGQMPNKLRDLTSDGEALLTCFIKPWSDDVSGGRTKQYQAHENLYVAHANIPGKFLNQEFFVRFASTATHASSTEQFAALKHQLDENNKTPIRVYHATSGCFVRLRIFILNLPADNPAQSVLSSHIGGKGNCPCRRCKVGGPSQIVESVEGYRAFYLRSEPRTVQDTVKQIQEQIEVACKRVEDHVTALQTKTGVKDQTAQQIITTLIKRGREIKARLKQPGKRPPDDKIMDEQMVWLNQQPPHAFNILFQMHGLDPHRDTPVEILHTILLGIEKYVWHSIHSSLKEADLQLFGTRLQSSDTDGLDVDAIRASYIIKYPNNLIGRHLKMIMQLTVFQVHGLVSDQTFTLIKSVGALGAVLWISEITNLELYLASEDLTTLVNNVLDAFGQIDPGRIVAKMKIHLLTHLVEDIRNHGPAVRYSTEVFECYNAVFRMCSVLSNHQAPSRDICDKMVDLERFRHIATGGYWASDRGVVRASQAVRSVFESSLKLQSHLGWVNTSPIVAGFVRKVPENIRCQLTWSQTVASTASGNHTQYQETAWFEGTQVTAESGDSCALGSWVVASSGMGTIIGRVEQILVDCVSQFGLVVLDTFKINDVLHKEFDMPLLVQPPETNNRNVIPSKNIRFQINVQHDCRSLQCPTSGIEIVRQERINSSITRQSIEHRNEQLYIINMHALHNAQLIRDVLPAHLARPIPLYPWPARGGFLESLAHRYQLDETRKRTQAQKKRDEAKAAKVAKAAEETAAARAMGDADRMNI